MEEETTTGAAELTSEEHMIFTDVLLVDIDDSSNFVEIN